MLIKIILFIVVISWIFRGIVRFFSIGLFGQAQQQQQRGFSNGRQYQQSRNNSDGNINIDYAPKKKSKKSSENFKGGDYVDYEEVD
ncbi:MAG: DUF4834 family protein [Roseivirga sp.]|jgi:hypothetical protein|uniref:DUF4834 family protein n=1 Tax=Roseivirga sp. TaxID=1964215 RepID=UPI001B1116E7|nr:DUF4834 family protein [Roseivirga sp.]MBO6495477.1 DUF4834 family protein [Roseivirga sp.]